MRACLLSNTIADNDNTSQGTPPYISGEILSDEHYFISLEDSEPLVHHDAVHDIESFFWVLVKICLPLKGPGECRDELAGDPAGDPEDIPESGHGDHQRIKHLWSVVWHLFNSDLGCLYILRIFAPSQVELYCLTKPVVYRGRGSRRLDVDCSMGQRPIERADEPPSTNPPLPGWVWVHIKGGGVGVGGWGKEKPRDEVCRGEAREALWIMLTIA